MAKKPVQTVTYKPGQIVPKSGTAHRVGPRGGRRGEDALHVIAGKRFPPTPKSGEMWVIAS
ncbi:MAG: hypothetical protein O3A46_01705 [Candidatus Poribacteria bacterium]|nr:hypothetical protein [Candidatus Poribacteria bacterium]